MQKTERPKLTENLVVPKGQRCEIHLKVGSEVLAEGAFITITKDMPLSKTGRLNLADAGKVWVCNACGRELVRREQELHQQRRRQLEERSRSRSSEHRQAEQEPVKVFRRPRPGLDELLDRIDGLTA